MIALLHGPDSARARMRMRELLGPHRATYLAAKDIDPVPAELETTDLLGDPRAFVLRLESKERPDGKELQVRIERLARRLEPQDIFIIVVPGALAEKHTLVQLVSRALGGTCERFERLEGDALVGFVRAHAERTGAPVSDDSARYLAEAFSEDPDRLLLETEKAGLLALAGQERLVRIACPSERAADRFGLVDAVAEKDARRMLAALTVIIDQGESLIGINALIASKIRTLIAVAASTDDARLTGSLGLNPYALRIARRQVSRWTPVQLRRLYGELLRLDAALKGPARDQGPGRMVAVLARACAK